MALNEKFLNQSGVSTLWSRFVSKLTEDVNAVDTKVSKNTADISTMKGQIEALEAGTYDDTEVRNLISANTTNIGTNTTAIAANTAALATLNGTGEGSVTATAAAEVAKVVANADASFDTLKEIADWILNDTTGAAGMANDIAALETLVGDTAVATQISTAIDGALKVDGVDKYALASELTALSTKVGTLETNLSGVSGRVTTLEADLPAAVGRIETLEAAAHTHANKAVLDGITSTKVAEWDAAEENANGYTDTVFASIQALSDEEIDAAIAAASSQE